MRFCVREWIWCLPQAWKRAVWRNVCMCVRGHLEHQVWVLCVPLLCASLSAPPSATLPHLQRFLALWDSGHLQRISERREEGGKERKILRWQFWSVWKGCTDDYRLVLKFQSQIAFTHKPSAREHKSGVFKKNYLAFLCQHVLNKIIAIPCNPLCINLHVVSHSSTVAFLRCRRCVPVDQASMQRQCKLLLHQQHQSLWHSWQLGKRGTVITRGNLSGEIRKIRVQSL